MTIADTIAEAVTQVTSSDPDIIIMERQLPVTPGNEPSLEVLQSSYTPVIIMGDEDETAEMLELGADAYMVKPLNLAELLARVRSLLGRRTRFYRLYENNGKNRP